LDNPPDARKTRLIHAGGWALSLLILGAFVLLGFVPCTFALVFGLPCPGCGTTRALRALLEGDVARALHLNPLGPVVALLVGALMTQAMISVAQHGDARGMGKGRLGALLKHALLVAAAVEFGVWIARFFGAFGGPVPVR
jgi:hypothetical protein